jgi:H+/Cl- antiporter ClcA
MNSQAGKYIIIIGISIVVVGLIIYFFPNAFKWFGRLPGDVRIEKENFKVYFPITTMILLSVLLTLILSLLKKL